jgi:hypothetical protein
VTREFTPGKTAQGEVIHYIQHLCQDSANFVVKDNAGKIQLITSTSTGRKPVLKATNQAGVPYATTNTAKLLSVKCKIEKGEGNYGITYITASECKQVTNRNPYIIIGFF